MYADRPMLQQGSRPASLGASLAISSAILAALLLVSPNVIKLDRGEDLTAFNVKEVPPPPPIDAVKEKPRDEARKTEIFVPPTDNRVAAEKAPVTSTAIEPPYQPPLDRGAADTGADAGPAEPPRPLAFVAAQQDPRYARDFQPPYPLSEIRQGREGNVTVRVRIGTDGRVKAVEQMRATSPAFFEATMRQALAKWRFKPATRGGVAEESWRTMSVRFELTGG